MRKIKLTDDLKKRLRPAKHDEIFGPNFKDIYMRNNNKLVLDTQRVVKKKAVRNYKLI